MSAGRPSLPPPQGPAPGSLLPHRGALVPLEPQSLPSGNKAASDSPQSSREQTPLRGDPLSLHNELREGLYKTRGAKTTTAATKGLHSKAAAADRPPLGRVLKAAKAPSRTASHSHRPTGIGDLPLPGACSCPQPPSEIQRATAGSGSLYSSTCPEPEMKGVSLAMQKTKKPLFQASGLSLDLLRSSFQICSALCSIWDFNLER